MIMTKKKVFESEFIQIYVKKDFMPWEWSVIAKELIWEWLDLLVQECGYVKDPEELRWFFEKGILKVLEKKKHIVIQNWLS